MSENTFSRQTAASSYSAFFFLLLLDSAYSWSCWHRWRRRQCTWWQSQCISWQAWQHRPSGQGWHGSTAPTGTAGPVPWRQRPTLVSGPTLPRMNVKAYCLLENKVHTSCLSISFTSSGPVSTTEVFHPVLAILSTAHMCGCAAFRDLTAGSGDWSISLQGQI